MKTACSLLLLVASGCLALADDFKCSLPWTVAVVDPEGKPLSECTVVQQWGYNFGNIATNFTETVKTDKQGRVGLPGRGVAYPLSTMEKVVDRLMVRPGLGPWSNIFVWKDGYQGEFVYVKNDSRVLYTTNGMMSRVVLRPVHQPK